MDKMIRDIDSYMKHINFAYNCYVAYMALLKNANQYNDIINKAAGFFTVTRYALSKCVLLEFSKLFRSSTKEKTIKKLINTVRANNHLFTDGDAMSICEEAEIELEKLTLVIEKLKKRRDCDLAHNDPEWFFAEKNPAIESYISPKDIESLYAFSFGLCHSLLLALPGEITVRLNDGADDINKFVEEFSKLDNGRK